MLKVIRRSVLLIILFLISQIPTTVFIFAKELYSLSGQQSVSNSAILCIVLLTLITILAVIFLAEKLHFFDRLRLDFLSKKNTTIILVSLFALFLLSFLCTVALNSMGISDTANEEAFNSLFKNENPLLNILLVGIAAPLMEEVVFRAGIIRYLLPNTKYLSIVFSSALFGLAHGPTNIPSLLLYVSIGLILALTYVKTKRIEVSMSIHLLNNLISVLLFIFGIAI
ncbi:CPBP family intramembrane glutamic endopeptidase [Enterococcus sp. AZ126]|uniref:CPBP family intramembrane glutamic endopeptidase n=1 Tax=Enterococcus sp. AZ126 TaxID=2774635 RepID=UPI003F20D20D